MIYRITEISTVKGSRLTYVLVDFWRTKEEFAQGHMPVLTNDFLMQLRVTIDRIVTRDDGWFQLTDGRYVDPRVVSETNFSIAPFKREIVENDLPTEIRNNIEAYWGRSVSAGITGDHTSDARKPLYKQGKVVLQRPTAPIKRDRSDPEDVLARSDVKDMVGREKETRP